MSRLLQASLLAADPTDAGFRSAGAALDVSLAPVGKCSGTPTLTIAVVDDSGSVAMPGGADPISARYGELHRALGAVARKCRCGRELATVLHFDSPHGDIAPTVLNRRGLARLQPSLSIPRLAVGISELGPSLRRATKYAEAHPEHEVTLVIFSDFQLFDPDPAVVAAALESFPGTVIAAVLGAHDDEEIPGTDQRIAIGYDSPRGSVANALLAGLTRHRKGVSPR